MRIGIFAGSIDSTTDLQEQVAKIVKAEEDGFDSFWSAQILGVDSLTLLALAGQQTDKIEMGTAVIPSYPQHPIRLAQQALTTNAATHGRLSLGIGLSHKPVLEERFGLSLEKPMIHMKEYVTVLRKLVHDSSANFAGEMFNVNAEIQVPSAQPFPILIAALGPNMLRIAGEMADGTITWMVGPHTLKSHIVPRISAAAEKAGREQPRICVGVQIAVTDDKKTAYQVASQLFSRYGNLPSYRRMLDIEGSSQPADLAIIGTEAQIEDQIQALSSAGATDLLAAIFPADKDAEYSVTRTQDLLKRLVGKI